MFNKEQARAIAASSKNDVLIAAGAGSGKTKTLSERVFRLVQDGELRPDELLVLTFTNNAAHEMKTRILQRFGPDHPQYPMMLSCHVQSFDSFNAYLVRLYAGRLGVAPTFSICSDTLLQQKKMAFVDAYFERLYEEGEGRAKALAFLSKFGMSNDRELKKCALDLLQKFERFTPARRAEFIATYQARFLSDDFIEELRHDIVSSYREELRAILREAYILDRLSHLLVRPKGEAVDFDALQAALQDPTLYTAPLSSLSISPDTARDDTMLDDGFQDLLRLLEASDDTLIDEALSFMEDHPELYDRAYLGVSKKEINDANYHSIVFKALKRSREALGALSSIDDLTEEAAKLRDLYPCVSLLFDCILAVERRLDEDRRAHNRYSFADITALALSLFTEPAYDDLAETIRNRFNYIMVDEYQDTNDFQEIFLEGLLKPRKDGTRAHLFCVGDAKQSIYAFRNSNVALFRAREARYHVEEGAEVIAMNTNYRSAKRLLAEINHVFSYYMRLDSGGIDYLQPMERLRYDEGVNLYHTDLPAYGVHRILPPHSFTLGAMPKGTDYFSDLDYESKTILHDIEQKLASGYLVFERGKGARPCKRSDFCILLRKKRSVRTYQKLFRENGIPINNHTQMDLREVNAILMLESLLNLLSYAYGDEGVDLPHCFASVARSYLFQYDDQRVHDILLGAGFEGKVTSAIEDDPLMRGIHSFAKEHEDDALPSLFIATLRHFKVLEKLDVLGDVEDNVAKIESLYALIGQVSADGGGLSEFIALIKDIDKRALPVSSESVFEVEDAVDLMTIHASKGLERKIVYLPSSENGISRGDARMAPLFTFDEALGVNFPYCELPYDQDLEDGYNVDTRTLPLRKREICGDDGETQEHVRLLYVALTRAENEVLIVGRPKGRYSAYVMMKDVPYRLSVHPSLLALCPAPQVEAFTRIARSFGFHVPEVANQAAPDARAGFELFRDHELSELLKNAMFDVTFDLLKGLYEHYRDLFLAQKEDLDVVSRLFASVYVPTLSGIDGFAALRDALSDSNDEAEEIECSEEEGEEDEEGEDTPMVPLRMDEQALRKRLALFVEAVDEGDSNKLYPDLALAQKYEKGPAHDALFINTLLDPFARYFSDVAYVCYASYACEDYEDATRFIDVSHLSFSPKSVAPSLPSLPLDDAAITFPKKQRGRASKKAVDEELPSAEVLARGERLHRYMELLDFETFDTSFIPDPLERALIDRALKTPLLSMAKGCTVYREYGYYDDLLGSSGFIDMLFVRDGVYHIVDYKSSSIDDPSYDSQLKTYARNVMRLFDVAKENVRCHLLSLRKGSVRDVDVD